MKMKARYNIVHLLDDEGCVSYVSIILGVGREDGAYFMNAEETKERKGLVVSS